MWGCPRGAGGVTTDPRAPPRAGWYLKTLAPARLHSASCSIPTGCPPRSGAHRAPERFPALTAQSQRQTRALGWPRGNSERPRGTAREGEDGKNPPECECLGASVPLPISMPCSAPISPQFPSPSPQTCSFSHKALQGLRCPLSSAPAALRHALRSRHGARSHVLWIFHRPRGSGGLGHYPPTQLPPRGQPQPGLPSTQPSPSGACR